MVGEPLTTHPEEHDHDLLRMPDYRQAQNASECIYYALWTAIHYVANSYPDKNIRNEIGKTSDEMGCRSGGRRQSRSSRVSIALAALCVGGASISRQRCRPVDGELSVPPRSRPRGGVHHPSFE